MSYSNGADPVERLAREVQSYRDEQVSLQTEVLSMSSQFGSIKGTLAMLVDRVNDVSSDVSELSDKFDEFRDDSKVQMIKSLRDERLSLVEEIKEQKEKAEAEAKELREKAEKSEEKRTDRKWSIALVVIGSLLAGGVASRVLEAVLFHK